MIMHIGNAISLVIIIEKCKIKKMFPYSQRLSAIVLTVYIAREVPACILMAFMQNIPVLMIPRCARGFQGL